MKRYSWISLALLVAACAELEPSPVEEGGVDIPGEGETGSALFRLPWGVERLSFVVEHGRAIFEGDMDLGSVEELYAAPAADEGGGGAAGGVIKELGRRWPDGKVRYMFAGGFTPEHRIEVKEAFQQLAARLPVSFTEITQDSGNYIWIGYDFDQNPWGLSHGGGGMVGGRQELTFKYADRPIGLGGIKHETLHALGFFHEQGRPDRDWFVYVAYNCIDPDRWGDYDLHGASEARALSPYDYKSIMHYSSTTACLKENGACKCPTMMNYYNGSNSFGGGDDGDLTTDDANSVFLMYAQSGLVNQAGDNLGRSVATGDFDKDGYADVAAGIPFEDVDGVVNAGQVRIFKGTALGLVPWQSLTQDDNGGANEAGDLFGEVLAVGDYDKDGYADLAVGTPHEDIGLTSDSGAVFLFRGSKNGLVADGLITQTSEGVSVEETGDLFGAALAFGAFANMNGDELAVGAPQERNSWVRSGAVFVFHFDVTDGFAYKPTKITQAGLGAMDPNDRFGAALAAKDLDNDKHEDLVVGAPEPNGGTGAIYLFEGTSPIPLSPSWQQGPMVLPVSEVRYWLGNSGDLLDSSIAVGNFDNQRALDVAVGAPGRLGQGRVIVWYAGGFLLGTGDPGYFGWYRELAQSPLSDDEPGDQFGFALAAGNFVGSNVTSGKIDDLVVGVPGENASAGQILMFEGTTSGLAPKANVRQIDFPSAAEEAGDRMGAALAVGNIDRIGPGSITINPLTPFQSWGDIVIGAPGEGPGSDPAGSGVIFTVLGNATSPSPDTFYHQESEPGY